MGRLFCYPRSYMTAARMLEMTERKLAALSEGIMCICITNKYLHLFGLEAKFLQ